MPDEQIVDLSRDMDFSVPEDRFHSLQVLKRQPRLVVLRQNTPDQGDEAWKQDLHGKWVADLARRQSNANLGFIIVRERGDPVKRSIFEQHVSQLSNCEFVPLEWCKFGLISRDENHTSGIYTNIPEISHACRKQSESVLKRHKNIPLEELDSQSLTHDLLRELKSRGWLACRNIGTTIESFMSHAEHCGSSTNIGRIADDLAEWVRAEELCTFDLANHEFLVESFPQTSGQP